MNTNWKIDTHGDPLGVLQKLVGAIWKQTGLDVLVDIKGRSLGNQVDVFLDARDLKDISMARSGDEYRISGDIEDGSRPEVLAWARAVRDCVKSHARDFETIQQAHERKVEIWVLK